MVKYNFFDEVEEFEVFSDQSPEPVYKFVQKYTTFKPAEPVYQIGDKAPLCHTVYMHPESDTTIPLFGTEMDAYPKTTVSFTTKYCNKPFGHSGMHECVPLMTGAVYDFKEFGVWQQLGWQEDWVKTADSPPPTVTFFKAPKMDTESEMWDE